MYLNSLLFPRNIRPKTTQSLRPDITPNNSSALLANFMTSIPKSSPAVLIQQEYLQQRLRDETLNANMDMGSNKLQIGRQGPIKDVKSLIDDYRQRHPEAVPRRGRRMKNINQNIYMGDNASSGGIETHGNDDLGIMLSRAQNDMSSPPTSNDSSYGNLQHQSKSGIIPAAFAALGIN